jgi:hypothetical protein
MTEHVSGTDGPERPAPRPNIYLGTDGAYHDDTDENRGQFPAAEDQVEPNPDVADAERDTPDPTTEVAPDAGTVAPAGDQAGAGDTTPPAPAAPAPAEPTVKTRNR